MISRLSCVLKLNSSIDSADLLTNDVTIYSDGVRYRHTYKKGSFFVLSDMSEGEHLIKITSWKYQTAEIKINVDYSVNFDISMVRYVIMNPSPSHPTAAKLPSIRGSFGRQTDYYILREDCELKIAEDSAKEGSDKVKLFSSVGKPVFPSVFLIKDKTESKHEFVVIKGLDGDSFLLDSPLMYAHARSTSVVPLIKLTSEADGSFFAVLSGGFKKDDSGRYLVKLFADKGGKLVSKEITAADRGETALGLIEV
ncbi:MAG: hypothetical protein ACI4KM_07165 [Oscillospiraceae bacterium]